MSTPPPNPTRDEMAAIRKMVTVKRRETEATRLYNQLRKPLALSDTRMQAQLTEMMTKSGATTLPMPQPSALSSGTGKAQYLHLETKRTTARVAEPAWTLAMEALFTEAKRTQLEGKLAEAPPPVKIRRAEWTSPVVKQLAALVSQAVREPVTVEKRQLIVRETPPRCNKGERARLEAASMPPEMARVAAEWRRNASQLRELRLARGDQKREAKETVHQLEPTLVKCVQRCDPVEHRCFPLKIDDKEEYALRIKEPVGAAPTAPSSPLASTAAASSSSSSSSTTTTKKTPPTVPKVEERLPFALQQFWRQHGQGVHSLRDVFASPEKTRALRHVLDQVYADASATGTARRTAHTTPYIALDAVRRFSSGHKDGASPDDDNDSSASSDDSDGDE